MAADPDRLQRFEREARSVAALNHPHVLTVYDVGACDGLHYVVTEPLEGETLRDVLTHRTPSPRQALDFAVQAARGLAAAHKKGLVHRDFRPENLFLTTEGRLRILDFGFAKLPTSEAEVGTGATSAGPTGPGVGVRTVAYLSPEQVQGLPESAAYDPGTDAVYVSNYDGYHPSRGAGRQSIAWLSPDGGDLEAEWLTGLNNPTGLTVHGGRLYAVEPRHVVEIDPRAGAVVARHAVPNAAMLNDIAAAPDGSLYLPTFLDNRVVAYTLG